MKNVEMALKGNMLHIQIDLSKRFEVSASGKSLCVASTSGNIPVGDGGVKMGLNAYIPVSAVKTAQATPATT